MTKVFREDQTPPVTQALLDYLDKRYPLSLFKTVKDEQKLFTSQGHHEVIDHLRSLLVN